MATTILGNIKQSKDAHLKRSIAYIMNPKKTENGLWVGSNCGSTVSEIYNSMMATKEGFEKTKGRQGYHFVLSFPPGETDEETAYEIAKEFCEEYFDNSTDYVFSVHNDHEHIHAHIVFNSVNRITGYKYRYENGDWEKYIQPITDRLARAHGLGTLEYDRSEKKGKSYAELLADKSDHMTQRKILKADIDFAISQSGSMEDFFEKMQEMGYRLRFGESAKHGRYISYTPPNYIKDGKKKGFRDYTGWMVGYSFYDLQKIFEGKKIHVPLPINLVVVFSKESTYGLQRNYVERITQAILRHSYYAEDLDQAQVRKDLLKIHKLEEECGYLIKNGITGLDEVKARLKEVKAAEKREVSAQRNRSDIIELDSGLKAAEERFWELDAQIGRGKHLSSEEYEQIVDEMEKIADRYPMIIDEPEKQEYDVDQLKVLRKEKSILRRIIKESDITLNVRYQKPVRELTAEQTMTKGEFDRGSSN